MRARVAAKPDKPEESIARAFARTLFGPLLWAFHFTTLYALHTLICTADSASGRRAMVIASTVLTIATLALLTGAFMIFRRRAWVPARDAGRGARIFLNDIAAAMVVVSAAGVLWAGAAAGFIEPCAALR